MASARQIPESVIVEILSRLPVKSLLRFRCICKSWRALIRSPFFIAKHLHHFNSLTWDSSDVQVLVRRYDYITDNEVFSILSPESLEISVSISMRFLNTAWRVMGLCNGVFCLCGNGDNMALWNFATKEFKTLPLSQITPPPGTIDILHDEIGFGFDDRTNEYKVVRVVSNYMQDHTYSKQVELYTLSTNSWEEIAATMPQIDTYPTVSNTWLNGAFHWWGMDNQNGYAIVSFDMVDEVFKKMLLPSYVTPGASTKGILTILDRSLSLIVFPGQETNPCFSVWIMDDYGYQESWNRKWMTEPILEIDRPLGFSKDGVMFLESYNGELVKYDPVNHESKHLEIYGGGRRSLQMVIYTDSLVQIMGKRGRVTVLKA